MVLAIVLALLSLSLIFGGAFVLKRQIVSSAGGNRGQLLVQLTELTKEIEATLAEAQRFLSKGQLESASKHLEAVRVEFEREKQNVKDIEARLDLAQKSVEEKEGQQQEVKSATEEEGLRLQELLEHYKDVSDESVTLEQKVAESMKNLDSILAEVQLTQTQRAAVDELSVGLSSAGERLRDLLTEYATVNERLEMLTQQHKDLEEEYTRLVEQQLGE